MFYVETTCIIVEPRPWSRWGDCAHLNPAPQDNIRDPHPQTSKGNTLTFLPYLQIFFAPLTVHQEVVPAFN